ncbi:hypothetical protein P43SY_011993 [Pythium insidiosum]|uniref:Uncharacterized protein n=1 Tax=Pythium insidiosum TaxID=114742 RepID=A0AAD5LRP1_PYTIN|nr:hypothetical protein P43SY_011993 [Pythium insidiosum]
MAGIIRRSFILPHGPDAGLWAYGVTTGYRFQPGLVSLNILNGDTMLSVQLQDPPQLIKVDNLNYALCIGNGINATVLNAFELLDKQDTICMSCKGKLPQTLLELTQQMPSVVRFHALPPVLRGLYEFGFGIRGLSLMHCKKIDVSNELALSGSNMTDFSERNRLPSVPDARSRSDVSGALLSLRTFARYFYNTATNDIILAAAAFVDDYTHLGVNDASGWNHVAFWISKKFGSYRSFLVCGDLDAASRVHSEFHRHDDGLAQLEDLRHAPRRDDSHVARPVDRVKHARQTQRLPVPDSVLASLPRQGNKALCMRFVSAAGCRGNGHGGCANPRLAHFRPATKHSAEAIAFITSRYNGLSHEHADI